MARVQGLKANVEHFKKSAVMSVLEDEYKPVIFQNGNRVGFINFVFPNSSGATSSKWASYTSQTYPNSETFSASVNGLYSGTLFFCLTLAFPSFRSLRLSTP